MPVRLTTSKSVAVSETIQTHKNVAQMSQFPALYFVEHPPELDMLSAIIRVNVKLAVFRTG